MVETCSREEFDRLVATGRPVLAQVEVGWCGSCHRMAPELDEIAYRHHGELFAVRIDAEREPWVIDRYDVVAYPTYVMVENEQELLSCVGVPDAGLGWLVERILP